MSGLNSRTVSNSIVLSIIRPIQLTDRGERDGSGELRAIGSTERQLAVDRILRSRRVERNPNLVGRDDTLRKEVVRDGRDEGVSVGVERALREGDRANAFDKSQ